MILGAREGPECAGRRLFDCEVSSADIDAQTGALRRGPTEALRERHGRIPTSAVVSCWSIGSERELDDKFGRADLVDVDGASVSFDDVTDDGET